MTAPASSEAILPRPPARAFLVGLGGIGMSGLAQYLQARGYAVAGSDRLLDGPGRQELVDKLRRLGIAVFPQDGSGPREFRPDVLVASAAVEPGNPDFLASPACPVCSRARALATLLDREAGRQIAVAGSAGKTTVTGWLAASLRALGHRVVHRTDGHRLRRAPSRGGEGQGGRRHRHLAVRAGRERHAPRQPSARAGNCGAVEGHAGTVAGERDAKGCRRKHLGCPCTPSLRITVSWARTGSGVGSQLPDTLGRHLF